MRIRKRFRLPHWNIDGGTYFVTFNLIDAIPAAARSNIEGMRAAYAAYLAADRESLTPPETAKLRRFVRIAMERTLDRGLGRAWLRNPPIADLVRDALLHFDDDRYHLLAWCVMLNHVHVVFQLAAGQRIDDVIGSWKGFTTHRANEILGRTGAFWQPDYFDRSIRGAAHLQKSIEYVVNNPQKAGLEDWRWVGYSDDYEEPH